MLVHFASAVRVHSLRLLPRKGWGVIVSQLNLPSGMPLSVAGCGRLQLGVALLVISEALVNTS